VLASEKIRADSKKMSFQKTVDEGENQKAESKNRGGGKKKVELEFRGGKKKRNPPAVADPELKSQTATRRGVKPSKTLSLQSGGIQLHIHTLKASAAPLGQFIADGNYGECREKWCRTIFPFELTFFQGVERKKKAAQKSSSFAGGSAGGEAGLAPVDGKKSKNKKMVGSERKKLGIKG